jgi:hypothetical protein
MSLLISGDLRLRKEFQWNETVWNPSMISTALWLDAADATTVTTVSGAVSQWNDKSGNGRNATQGTAGNRPVYQASAQNGLNAVRFTAASSHSLSAGTTSTWDFLHDGNSSSVFIVARVRSTGDNPNAIHCYLSTGAAATSSRGYSIAYDDTASDSKNNALHIKVARGSTAFSVSDNTNDKITPGTYHILSSYVDADNATAGNRSASRIDGSAAFGSNVSTFPPSTSNSNYALTLGRDLRENTLDFTGDICEVLIFNTQPDTLDRQKLEGYLANKWGLTANLPADHPYKTVGPTP